MHHYLLVILTAKPASITVKMGYCCAIISIIAQQYPKLSDTDVKNIINLCYIP